MFFCFLFLEIQIVGDRNNRITWGKKKGRGRLKWNKWKGKEKGLKKNKKEEKKDAKVNNRYKK